MTSAAPTRWTEQLSALLLEQLQPARKVLLTGVGPLSAEQLQSGGGIACGQLLSPRADEIEKLAVEPNVIVVQDFGGWSTPPRLLKALATKFPDAELLIWFWNSCASSLVLSQLLDRREPRTVLSESEVRSWLSELGLAIRSRRALRAPGLSLLARDTEQDLQGLFQQLNPASEDDLIVYRVERAHAPSAKVDRLSPELLSIVLWVDQGSRFLDDCLFSVSCQSYRPLELIVVSRGTEAEVLDRMVSQYAMIEPFAYRVLLEPKSERAEALNRAIEHGRGRYLGFLSADEVIFPEHYVRLIQKLAATDAAWAMSGFLRAYLDERVATPAFIRWKRESPPRVPFDLSFFQYNRPIGCSLLIDRTRLGRFRIAFSHSEGPVENDALFVKLAALFRPAMVQGPPSCEQRISGATPTEAVPEAPKIQVLVPLSELTAAAASRSRLLRALEQGKIQLRLRVPRFYRVAKQFGTWCSKLVSRRTLREHVERLSRGGQ